MEILGGRLKNPGGSFFKSEPRAAIHVTGYQRCWFRRRQPDLCLFCADICECVFIGAHRAADRCELSLLSLCLPNMGGRLVNRLVWTRTHDICDERICNKRWQRAVALVIKLGLHCTLFCMLPEILYMWRMLCPHCATNMSCASSQQILANSDNSHSEAWLQVLQKMDLWIRVTFKPNWVPESCVVGSYS